MISASLCVRCKGKLLCGAQKCAVLEHYSSIRKTTSLIKGREFEGSSPPSIFVSWKNYPNISIAPLAPAIVDEKNSLLDAPEQWYGFHPDRIVSMREQLIQSNARINAFEAANPSYELLDLQEIVMAERPVELEIELQHRPLPSLSFHESVAPMGPQASLESMSLVSNPRIPKKVDYLVSDVSVKSNDALLELYADGFPVSSLYKLLSSGALGVKKNRKVTPTRWSITATDDTIGKALIEEIKEFSRLDRILVFESDYLDNHFIVMLLPSSWAFEQMEAWAAGSFWYPEKDLSQINVASDHEFYNGRKNYASNTEGAYYSARLAVCEHLKKIKKQAAAIVFREIGQGYQIALGVWVIRETVRGALRSKPLEFYDRQLAFKFVEKRFSVPFARWKQASKLMDFLQHQKMLFEF